MSFKELNWNAVDVSGSMLRYYLRQPTASDWAAVGVIYPADDGGSSETACRMLVGLGHTEDEAITDLLQRARLAVGGEAVPGPEYRDPQPLAESGAARGTEHQFESDHA